MPIEIVALNVDPRALLERLIELRNRRRQLLHLRAGFDADLADIERDIDDNELQLARYLAARHAHLRRGAQ